MKIFIDPNHGHCDPGCSGYRNLYDESEILFEISLLLKSMIESNGFDAMMSRGLEKKSNYLTYQVRGQRASEFGADFAITLDFKYITKHAKSYPDSYVGVYCNENIYPHRVIYELLSKNLPKELGPVKMSHFTTLHSANEIYYEYRGCAYKSMFLSLGVMNHKDICEYISSADGRNAIARAITDSVFDAFKNTSTR